MSPTWLVMVGWLTLRRRAAAVKLPSVATARNARAWAGVIEFDLYVELIFEFELYQDS